MDKVKEELKTVVVMVEEYGGRGNYSMDWPLPEEDFG